MTTPFGLLLREYRERRRRMSQSRLAERAGFNHTYVSRLENGSRQPSARSVDMLADALQLTLPERDSLLIAAGFMPGDTANVYAAEPLVGALADLLADGTIPRSVRDDVRQMLLLMIRQAQRTRARLDEAAD